MSLVKVLFFLLLLIPLTPSTSYAELSSGEWTVSCKNKEKKKQCIMGTVTFVDQNNTGEKQLLAKIYIRISEEKVPIFYAELPLNTNLMKMPMLSIEEKKILDLKYLHCNKEVGCKAGAVLDVNNIKAFKKGKTLSLYMNIFGNNQAVRIDFPLKNFTKSYKKITL
jgi:invasion protein IalB